MSTSLRVEAQNADLAMPVEAAPATFGELLAGFSEMPGLEARFEEEKFLSLLAAPLRSRGRLYFMPPSTLLRQVESPARQNILVRESLVRISSGFGEGGGDVQTIDLSARAEIRPLVESMLWIFTGDRTSLEETYRVDYQVLKEEGQGHWQVRFTPKEAPLSNLIQELWVRGKARAATSLELVETSGDRTLTRFFEVDPDRTFDAVARRELFGESLP